MSVSFTIDPIHGKIDFPIWFENIKDHPLLLRTMYIRQLGLKSSIDYPGAIHTRYSHLLGTMHLARQLCNILERKATNDKMKSIISDNKENVVAAALFHDVGHGPFSHALDYVLYKYSNKTHELLSTDIIKKIYEDGKLIQHNLNLDTIIGLIQSSNFHTPLLKQIIDGPLDVDKLDYLLRDSYHVGLRYSFDVQLFLEQYKIIGDESDSTSCELGLVNTCLLYTSPSPRDRG